MFPGLTILVLPLRYCCASKCRCGSFLSLIKRNPRSTQRCEGGLSIANLQCDCDLVRSRKRGGHSFAMEINYASATAQISGANRLLKRYPRLFDFREVFDLLLFPLLIIVAKSGTGSDSFDQIEIQTTFSPRTILKIQEDLRLESDDA